MTKQFKNNVVYILKIDSQYFYIGCHCWKHKSPSEVEILNNSGNFLNRAVQQHEISRDEYHKRVDILSIEEFDSAENALDREAELIQRFKEYYGNICVNQTPGNKYGPMGLIRSEDTRKRMSEALKGRIFSKETRERMSEAKRGQILSEKHKKKISESKGVLGILQYSKDGKFIKEYPSIHEAERQTRINQNCICRCCKNKLKTAGGFLWKYKTA